MLMTLGQVQRHKSNQVVGITIHMEILEVTQDFGHISMTNQHHVGQNNSYSLSIMQHLSFSSIQASSIYSMVWKFSEIFDGTNKIT